MVLSYDLNFETVVNKLGVPDYVDFGKYHPEVGGTNVSLFWVDQRIIVSYVDTHDDKLFLLLWHGGKFPPTTRVTDIIYMSKDGFTDKPLECCSRILWPGFSIP